MCKKHTNAVSLPAFVCWCLWLAIIPDITCAALAPRSYTLEGIVERLEPDGRRTRAFIRPLHLNPMPERKSFPGGARITLHGKNLPRIGDEIRVLVRLEPPRPPIMPGAFDYQEYLWRQGVDAVGFAYGLPEVLRHHPPDSLREAARRWLHRQRMTLASALHRRMAESQQGAVLVAFVTGERGFLHWQTEEQWRVAGITHLLSISGTHIGLLIGFVFVVIRGSLTLTPLGLHYPVRKWAAIIAWMVAGAYTLLAGADVPTVRSYLMASVVLLGILLERKALSLWTLFLAAIVILLVNGHAWRSAGFQFSFLAVGSLILFFRWQEGWPWRLWCHERGLPGRILWMLPGLVLSGALVTIVTAPVALYHFQRLAVYGTLSNVIAIPLTGLVIMPALLAALLLWPLGGEGLFLAVAAWGAQGLNHLAETVSALPYAQWRVAAFPPVVAVLVLLALPMAVWLPRWYRLGALIPLLVAAIITVCSPLPDVVITGTGKQAGFYDNGTLWVSGSARSFLAREWANRYGLPAATPLPADACDETGCLVYFHSQTIALPQVPEAVGEDCRYKNRIIITPLDAPVNCRARSIHDYSRLRYNGSTALWLDSGKIRTDRQERKEKPWAGYE